MSISAERSAAHEPIVPCLVHKHSADNVWIRQPHPDAGTEARLAYHYPENFEQARLADLIEVQRQAGIFYVHSHLGVPADHVFVLSSISLERLTLSFDQTQEIPADGGSVIVRLHRAPVGTNTRLSFYLFANAGMATGGASVRLLPRRASTVRWGASSRSCAAAVAHASRTRAVVFPAASASLIGLSIVSPAGGSPSPRRIASCCADVSVPSRRPRDLLEEGDGGAVPAVLREPRVAAITRRAPCDRAGSRDPQRLSATHESRRRLDQRDDRPVVECCHRRRDGRGIRLVADHVAELVERRLQIGEAGHAP